MNYRLNRIKKHVNVKWGEYLGRPECPYLRRWALAFGAGSVRVHHFYRSDDERAHHDHPWGFVTLVLKGGYTDVTDCGACHGKGIDPAQHGQVEQTIREIGVLKDVTLALCEECGGLGERLDHLLPGSVRYRPALHRHTVRTDPGGVWTVIVTGPNLRKWGFWVNEKFVKANKYHFRYGVHPCDQP